LYLVGSILDPELIGATLAKLMTLWLNQSYPAFMANHPTMCTFHLTHFTDFISLASINFQSFYSHLTNHIFSFGTLYLSKQTSAKWS